MVQKIGEFEKSKFEKSGVIYKGFLRQTQGSKEKVQKIGEFKKSHVCKIGVQLYAKYNFNRTTVNSWKTKW